MGDNDIFECPLPEFHQEYISDDLPTVDLKELESVFRGEIKNKPRFRICVGDAEVFFNSRELLCRFVTMPTPNQKDIIDGFIVAMKRHKVNRVVIEIPWSKSGKRKLEARVYGTSDWVLDLELVG